MDNNRIGSRGEDIARYKLGASQYLEPQIKGEKYPIWDGEVLVYSSDNHKKQNIVGRVPVQIKAAKPGFPAAKMKRKAKTVDLRNYLEEGGAIYLGVLLTPDGDGVMYYKALLPLDIKKLLKAAGKQKTVNIDLGRLPEDPVWMADIFFRFIRARKRSMPSINMNVTSLEELREMGFTVNGNPIMWVDSLIQSNVFNPLSLTGADLYSYVKVQELGGLLVPVEHFEFITDIHVSDKRDIDVAIGDEIYFSSIDIDISEACTCLSFGGFTISLAQDTATFTYRSPSKLNERILGDKAVSAIAAHGQLSVGETVLQLQDEDIERCKRWCENRCINMQYLEDCSKALAMVGCVQELELENMTEEDENKLRNLVNIVVFGHTCITQFEYDSLVMTLTISNLNIKLLLTRTDGNSYTAENYFTQGWGFAKNEGDAYKPISVYSTIAAEEFATLSNIEVSSIASDLMRFDDADQLEQCNQTLLNLLSSYDTSHEQKLLECACTVANWLYDKSPESTVFYLNRLQALRRRNAIDNQDLQGLRERIATGSMSVEELAGAYILLGDSSMAITYLNNLPELERTKFKDYPIYSLLH